MTTATTATATVLERMNANTMTAAFAKRASELESLTEETLNELLPDYVPGRILAGLFA